MRGPRGKPFWKILETSRNGSARLSPVDTPRGRRIAGRSAHSASPSRDLPVAGLFVSFSPFSVLGLFVVFEGLYVLWIGGGYVKRVLGYSVVLRTLWKVEILGNRPLGRCWGGPAFLGPPGSKAWTS